MAAIVAVAVACVGATALMAKGGGGTAKPPKPGTVVPPPAATIPAVSPLGTYGTPNLNAIGFDVTGFIQKATLETAATNTICPGAVDPTNGTALGDDRMGGTVVVNGRTIVVPCNTVLQMPAATLNWSELFTTPGPSLALDGSAGTPALTYPATEVSIQGNIVTDASGTGKSIAGLIHISQLSLNGGFGFITGFEYTADANYILVGDSPTGPAHVRLMINDPNGRFGKAQSTDARFSVDDENPTIVAHSAFPMCVPRSQPNVYSATTVASYVEVDAECPQKNRPLITLARPCRTFATAGVITPAGWEIPAPAAGATRCSAFVMESTAASDADVTKPDPRKQVPFLVGDSINYTSTVMKGSGGGPNGSDTMSVHAIEANIGVYTQPGTLPSYITIEETIFGTDAIPVAGAGVAPLEGQDRFVMVGMTTDVVTPVDAYMVDFHPVTGKEQLRWITNEAMTGGLTPGTPPFGGGVLTQLTGPQPGRFRVRATKAPTGLLVSPTRNVRVISRTLCAPATATATGAVPDATHPAAFWDVNQLAPLITAANQTVGTVQCVTRAPSANGLFSGQYFAPVGEYIFPENVVAGDRLVPFNFWNLQFLVNGEGPGVGPLIPQPY